MLIWMFGGFFLVVFSLIVNIIFFVCFRKGGAYQSGYLSRWSVKWILSSFSGESCLLGPNVRCDTEAKQDNAQENKNRL